MLIKSHLTFIFRNNLYGSLVASFHRLFVSEPVTYKPRSSPTFSRKTNVMTPRISAIRSRSTIVIFMIVLVPKTKNYRGIVGKLISGG